MRSSASAPWARERWTPLPGNSWSGFAQRLAATGVDFLPLGPGHPAAGPKGLDPRYGARPLRRLIRNQVENPAAELLLREDIAPGETLYLEEKGGQLVLSPLS